MITYILVTLLDIRILGGGGGGLKGRNFWRVRGVPTRIIFHRVVKDAIDDTRHTYTVSICGLFWFVAQQKLEVDALSRKKTSRCLSQTSSSLLGVRLWIDYYFISLWYERNVVLLAKFRKIYLTFHMWKKLTFLWNELTILWNHLTIDWNDLTWNYLTMEQNDRIPDLSTRSNNLF